MKIFEVVSFKHGGQEARRKVARLRESSYRSALNQSEVHESDVGLLMSDIGKNPIILCCWSMASTNLNLQVDQIKYVLESEMLNWWSDVASVSETTAPTRPRRTER